MNEELIGDLAREIYHARTRSRQEMTDERWARIKVKFGSSVRVCREEAVRMIEDGEFYAD